MSGEPTGNMETASLSRPDRQILRSQGLGIEGPERRMRVLVQDNGFWRCGVSTAGFAQSAFFAETDGQFGFLGGSNLTWVSGTKKLSGTDAFLGFTFFAGAKVWINDGTGMTYGLYEIAAKDSDDQIELVLSPGADAADVGAVIADYSWAELFCPIGAPVSTQSSNNWPAEIASNIETDLLVQSPFWSFPVSIPPGYCVNGAELKITLDGRLQAKNMDGRPFADTDSDGTWLENSYAVLYITLDPWSFPMEMLNGDPNELAFKPLQAARIGYLAGTATKAQAGTIIDDGFTVARISGLLLHPLNNGNGIHAVAYDSANGIQGSLVDGGYYIVAAKAANQFTFNYPGPAGGDVAFIAGSETVAIARASKGSIFRIPFAMKISAAEEMNEPNDVQIVVRVVADGRTTQTEQGAIASIEMRTFPAGERVGPVRREAVAEGSGFEWKQAIHRTTPGRSMDIVAGTFFATAAPLVLAKASYYTDTEAAPGPQAYDAFYSTLWDWGGEYDKVHLNGRVTVPSISPTNGETDYPITPCYQGTDVSVYTTASKNSQAHRFALVTHVFRNSDTAPHGQVVFHDDVMRVAFIQPFRAGEHIESGDSLTFKTHRNVKHTSVSAATWDPVAKTLTKTNAFTNFSGSTYDVTSGTGWTYGRYAVTGNTASALTLSAVAGQPTYAVSDVNGQFLYGSGTSWIFDSDPVQTKTLTQDSVAIVAGMVEIGPHSTDLAIRMAMSGPQDGSCELQIRTYKVEITEPGSR